MRQTVYGILVNVLQSLATMQSSGEIDSAALAALLKRVQGQEVLGWFGLSQNPGSLELVNAIKEEGDFLGNVESVAGLLGEVLAAGAVSIGMSEFKSRARADESDCSNAWRARWMGLVAATCFQHNPSTQPQAFTVLGYLASDEVDDDLVYQILVAMSTTLSHFTESDTTLIVSMLRCLSRVIPGLLPDSRYASSLFWLAVGVCQLGYVPLFATALELLQSSLRSLAASGLLSHGLADGLMDSRKGSRGEAARKLDKVCGVNFDTDPHFSLVAVIFKGVRHPSTKKQATGVLSELLRLSAMTAHQANGDETPMIHSSSLAYFMVLLPLMAGNSADLKGLFANAGLAVVEESLRDVAGLSVFDLLSIP
jgi:neurofibromin 1